MKTDRSFNSSRSGRPYCGKYVKAAQGLLFYSFLLAALYARPLPAEAQQRAADRKASAGAVLELDINTAAAKQTIHSFGASDCWTIKYIGKWADTEKKDQIADLLFSTETRSDGSPKGIGLSLWRFNIGSGSFEQGADSDIRDEWRREECFLNPDGSYNWNKQQGQQWFMTKARSMGVKYTLGFSITPPVFMSQNGKAYNSSSAPNMNIKPGKMAAYADFLAQVSKHFRFDFLSPVNEPQWFWGKDRISQEGTQATNSEVAGLVSSLSERLRQVSPATSMVIGEAGQWDFLYAKNEDGRGDQINQFFSDTSANYIGNLPTVRRTISAHSYFTTCPADNMINVRKAVAARVQEVDPELEVWQTEFGILGNICDQYHGGPRNTGIDYGLYAASVIHHDLTVANVSSWQWWLAVSPYNYSDALIYINDSAGKINPAGCKEDGRVLDSKQLWAFGNYSRFVRPGMKRVEAHVAGAENPLKAASSLMISAYLDAVAHKLVLVLINPESQAKELRFPVQPRSFELADKRIASYTTDATRNLKKEMLAAGRFKLAPRSVTTIVATLK